ncbi:MAG TPA: amidase [Candidatus Limnocylindrales bacterium]|nr:amidase [Candidatus Limnocylindrales bacterium]
MIPDLAWGSIADLTALLRDGHLSAAELLEAQLERIERSNPALNAIVTLDVDGARRAAAGADAARRRGDVGGALHGLAVTLKDSHAVAGMRSTIGVAEVGDRIPAEDGTVAARIRAAGGTILGKTNLASWLYDIQGLSELFGRTNNPWDAARTTGGSSGGSAAAVAAGLTVADVGSDVGGSVRIPASFCGVVGFKPTEGRIPETGHQDDGHPRSHWVMESIGPFGRSVDDVGRLFGILAGPDGRDWAVPPVPIVPVPTPPLRGLRIAVAEALPGLIVQADVRAAVRRVARDLEAAGAIVEAAVPTVDLAAAREARSRLFRLADRPFRSDAAPGAVRDYAEALAVRTETIRAWEVFLAGFDAFLCPSTSTTAFEHRPMGEPFEVDGVVVEYWTPEQHSQPFNFTGQPAISLPAGLDGRGLPIGIQLVARRWHDAELLAVARAVEPVAGGFRPPPAFP